MSLSKFISPELVELGLEAGIALGKRLIQAIAGGDEAEWRPLIEILPEEMRAKATLIAEKEKTRAALEEELNG